MRVADAFATEREIHAALAARRVRRDRELFRLTDDEARAVLGHFA